MSGTVARGTGRTPATRSRTGAGSVTPSTNLPKTPDSSPRPARRTPVGSPARSAPAPGGWPNDSGRPRRSTGSSERISTHTPVGKRATAGSRPLGSTWCRRSRTTRSTRSCSTRRISRPTPTTSGTTGRNAPSRGVWTAAP